MSQNKSRHVPQIGFFLGLVGLLGALFSFTSILDGSMLTFVMFAGGMLVFTGSLVLMPDAIDGTVLGLYEEDVFE